MQLLPVRMTHDLLWRRGAMLLFASGLCSVMGLSACHGQGNVSYGVFDAMSQGELASAQLKLTYVGSQEADIPAIIIVTPGHNPDVAAFGPFYRPEFMYLSDSRVKTLVATPQELESLIDQVGVLGGVTDGNIDPNGVLSFSLLNVIGGSTKCFDSVVGGSNGIQLYERMRSALAGNPKAVGTLSWQACMTGLTTTTMAADLTANVQLHFRGPRRHLLTNEYRGTVQIRNVSGTMITGPLSLVLEPENTNIVLLNETGETCKHVPMGRSYIDVPIGAGLVPGGAVTVELRFENLSGHMIDLYWQRGDPPYEIVKPQLLAGPGER